MNNEMTKVNMDVKKKYERFRYTQKDLDTALRAIISGSMTLNKASIQFNVPKSTLHNKITHKVPWERKMGPPTELTSLEEAELVQWIINKAKLGFPMHPDEVIDTVQKYLNANNRVTKFTENKPGPKWLDLFLKRHPDLTKRNAEMISKARAAVTEEGIRAWFKELEDYLIEENALDIKNDPSRIFNSDETGVVLCPKTGKILSQKNYRNVYEIAHGKEKESLTVLCTFSADGRDVPPFVVYPYKRMPPSIASNFPDSWFIGRSDSGWMVSNTFFAYIQLFYDWLVENDRMFPVILFLDGHKSHINRSTTEFCKEKKILLFCLHPNATHILQPCDVGIFGPLKKCWKQVVRKYKQATTAPITKNNFAATFKKAYDVAIKPQTIKNSFRVCGLFPIDANAVDYSKCINTRRQEIADSRNDNYMQSEEYKEDVRSTIKVIESEIDRMTRNIFLDCYKENKPNEHSLYALWAKCKPKLDNKVTPQYQPSNEVPLDLSNTSTVEASSAQNSIALLDAVIENASSDNENSNHTTEQIVQDKEGAKICTTFETVVQIHRDPDVGENENIHTTQVDSESLILNTTDLFEKRPTILEDTDDVINFVVEQDSELLRMSTPPQITDPIPDNIQDYNTAEEPININSNCLTTLSLDIDENSSNIRLNETAITAIDANPNHIEDIIGQIRDSNNDIVAVTAPSSSLPSSSVSLQLSEFLNYPEIPPKKKNVNTPKEPVPFGLTGLKCKEYFARQDAEKQKKEEDLKQKQKKRSDNAELRKRKLEIKKETQLKKDQVPSGQPKPKKLRKKETHQPTTTFNEDIVTGKYLIVSFKTEKRIRYFVGQVLETNKLQKKIKIDFLRKKSVSENIVNFVRPQVPDVSEVDFADVHRVLSDPNISRRGFMSFQDVSFKDIE